MSHPQTATCDLLYGNALIIGDTPWAKDGTVYDGIFDAPKLLRCNICHQAIFYRTSLARSVGDYNTNYPVVADWDFTMRCWRRTKFGYLDMIIADFYSGGVSSQTTPDYNFQADYQDNVRRYGLWKDVPLRTKVMDFAKAQSGSLNRLLFGKQKL